MNTIEFDYDTFFNGLGTADTLSTTTTSSPSTISDCDSAIACTPLMSNGQENATIAFDDLDILLPTLKSPLSDEQNNEFFSFSRTFDEEECNSTFENLFSDIDQWTQQNQETSQQIPSLPQLPVAAHPGPEIPAITNCIKVRSYTNAAGAGPKCIKLEPINPTIKILTTAKPLTLTNLPIMAVPVATNDMQTQQLHTKMAVPGTSPAPLKRRRSDSPVNAEKSSGTSTITLEQLRLQYGNMNEEALRKHLRMIKNRESASLSRKRRKELMDTLGTKVQQLTDENEYLKKENSKLVSKIHTLEVENELLKKYKFNNPGNSPRKPLILMGIALLVVFNFFTIKSLTPISNNPSDSIDFYNDPRAVVPSRTILGQTPRNDRQLHSSASENDYRVDTHFSNSPSSIPNYPYIQCVAYLNKTHSQRINQDLRSWVQDIQEKEYSQNEMVISDTKSLTIPSNQVVAKADDSLIEPLHHVSRKVARQTKIQSENKGQLQPYKTNEANYDDFMHIIDRKNDTLYFISFKRDHLILPATAQNQTQRPKMSLILPASMANLNKSIHVPINHVPMIKIDCEVEDTKLVFLKRSHIPLLYRQELFQYYSSAPQATI